MNDVAGAVGSGAATENRESLTSRIMSLLRADIIAGALEPGSKLKIDELRQRYEVGASPIREALSLLTSTQLVERLDQKGFRVSRVSIEEFDELLKTRCWLDERALRESIVNGSKRWEEEVVIAAYRLSRTRRTVEGDPTIMTQEWETLHKRFHMCLLAQCGSRFLYNICDDLYDQNTRYRQAARMTAYAERDVSAEHDAITDAVLERDCDLAVSRLIDHYHNTGNFLRNSLHSQVAETASTPRTSARR
ncbi:GntR family transcriptional regulator [Pararhizobium mangrovi]|uniref:GntR family transcriptional regulator n=1 Tax=Pararhizobium mangrovi TaxID=2590452 RepID=A0A506UCU5_9HYPH|nr:GntR family transcriptional regulator [Pararhizobium mangrovi]TPW30625.1 GntR family transcriptional regulator [Pararhizobium mangrovi]